MSMYLLYNLFKFLHIVAAIVWIGGVLAIGVLNARLAREREHGALVALASQSSLYGQRIIGPAAVTALLSGIGMTAVAGIGAPLWVVWGLAGIFASLALGAVFIRRAAAELSAVAQASASAGSSMPVLQRRLAVLNTINLLVLVSVVWAMVFKPVL